jgi:hypothetical protein
MLFAFNNFWKVALIFLSAWALYGLGGYEFTMITIMVAILIQLSVSSDNE